MKDGSNTLNDILNKYFYKLRLKPNQSKDRGVRIPSEKQTGT